MRNGTAHSITIPEAMAVPMTSIEVLVVTTVAVPLVRLNLTAPAAYILLQTRFLEIQDLGRVLGRNRSRTRTELTSCVNILTVLH